MYNVGCGDNCRMSGDAARTKFSYINRTENRY